MVDIALTVALLYRAPAGWLSAKKYLLEFLLSSFSSIYILVGAEFSPTSLNHDHSVNCLFDFFVCMRAIEREHVRFCEGSVLPVAPLTSKLLVLSKGAIT